MVLSMLIFLIKFVCVLKVIRCSYNLINANNERIRYSNIMMGNENVILQDDVIVKLAYDRAKYRLFINTVIIIICLSIIF